MSIVGPRPVVEEELEAYGSDVDEFLSMRPGITGWWQVSARNDATYCDGSRQELELWHISTNFGLVSRRRLKRNPRSCSAASWEYGIRAGLACQTGDFAARRHSEIVRRPGSTANPLIGPAALPCARASLPSLVGGRPSNQPSNSTACGNYLHVSLFFGNFAIMTDRVHVLRVFHTCAPVAEYTRKRG